MGYCSTPAIQQLSESPFVQKERSHGATDGMGAYNLPVTSSQDNSEKISA